MSKATTKFAIAFAFKELLLEKSIDKITINDITEKCGINRQTFYYHFHDIYELIEWICETDADHVLKQNKTYDTWQEGGSETDHRKIECIDSGIFCTCTE